jgi:radical SAM superfamily enzyme YgiQ (UPF0313 family)
MSVPATSAVARLAPARVIRAVLLSTYDLGRAPFGLASPGAWLEQAGHSVRLNDLAVEPLDEDAVRAADLIAFHLPMHTATRLAVARVPQIRKLNPHARLVAYGLYAQLNREHLYAHGFAEALGGEFEAQLVEIARRAGLEASTPAENPAVADDADAARSMPRLQFLPPARHLLPDLGLYAHLHLPDGSHRVAGYTEATRGCRHRCRHCPVVPVYQGRLRIVQHDVVLEDVRRQVERGAQHLTFGDPDFLNGPGHTLPLVRAMRAEHPELSWDATIKIEHLVRHAELLPELAALGCVLITSAAESVDDHVLERLEKGHTRADFEHVARRVRDAGITLQPTFVAFTPWTAPESWASLLAAVAELELVEHVAPIQLAIRLLIPSGSRLLELDDILALVGPFDRESLVHPWRHPDPRVDSLQREAERLAGEAARSHLSRPETHAQMWALAEEYATTAERDRVARAASYRRPPVPHLTEPWYC